MRASIGVTLVAALASAAASLTAFQSQAPPRTPPPAAGADTRDRYLNPRETDLSLGLEVDPRDVPDIPPVEPDKVLDTFRIKKGFRLELVAHEPMVVDPIQMAFDEDGRLYVVEMRWYQSETRTDLMFDERIGRIRLLEDVDGDGRFDKSSIFADRLRYPSAVIPYDGGVYVGLEPDLIYLKDRNGDGVADFRQVVFTGFGNQRDRLDSQMFMNSLTWGLDNRIHGAKGHGGTITPMAARDSAPLDLRNRDFSFDPRSHTMRAESGGGKQGLSFDDYGRKFVCTANSAVQFLMYEDRYASRNPFYAPPRPLVDVALEQGETVDRQIVHRISPEDPWRRVRNRWRAEGVFAGPPPQPPTYLIGSSGVTLYRGNAFPAEYRQDVFIGIAGNNLVHHRRLAPDGVGFRARRLPDESTEEFLASTDLWFRPVAFANGPDGALYIADLYREILDFSDGIPESIKRFKDLNRGNDRGRIYRVVPDGFKQPALPKLGRASTAELVATLQHANAWHRETAARLIYERQDKGAIPALAAAGRAIAVGAGTPARPVCARRSRRAGGILRAARPRRSGSRGQGARRPPVGAAHRGPRSFRHVVAAAEGPRRRHRPARPLSARLHARRRQARGGHRRPARPDQEGRGAALDACRGAVLACRRRRRGLHTVAGHSGIRTRRAGSGVPQGADPRDRPPQQGQRAARGPEFRRPDQRSFGRVCVCDGIRRRPAARRRAAGAVPGEAPAGVRSRHVGGAQHQGTRVPSHPGDRPARSHGVHR